mmetsp:Transcript_18606/g.60874  ORF Transcript_18606/g.60874 Transcript_18606/m.60874 type:complete len:266 (-) Transcript_18606:147-944(-)
MRCTRGCAARRSRARSSAPSSRLSHSTAQLARAARTASCRMGACTASCASPARHAARAHEARRIRLSGGAARQCSAGPSSHRRSTFSRARPSHPPRRASLHERSGARRWPGRRCRRQGEPVSSATTRRGRRRSMPSRTCRHGTTARGTPCPPCCARLAPCAASLSGPTRRRRTTCTSCSTVWWSRRPSSTGGGSARVERGRRGPTSLRRCGGRGACTLRASSRGTASDAWCAWGPRGDSRAGLSRRPMATGRRSRRASLRRTRCA